MRMTFDPALAANYNSASQQAKKLTEGWVSLNMFCPACGNVKLESFKNNKPVSVFYCEKCKKIFELKSSCKRFGKRVIGASYAKMLDNIRSASPADFLFLSYDRSKMCVQDLFVVPGHFFTESNVIKRKPLSFTARRHGWVGCEIMLSDIPAQGRVYIISNGREVNRNDVLNKYLSSCYFREINYAKRRWAIDILRLVNKLGSNVFLLGDVYKFSDELSLLYPHNKNIQAKIRQQLQVLRDAGYITFLRRGQYQKNFSSKPTDLV